MSSLNQWDLHSGILRSSPALSFAISVTTVRFAQFGKAELPIDSTRNVFGNGEVISIHILFALWSYQNAVESN